MRRVLFVAFHFPPMTGSSGQLRALKFCRHLPTNGWQPIVLTVAPKAYTQVDPDSLRSVPSDITVLRPLALDTQRHLAIRGRYLRAFALPDRWVSWCLGALPAGLRAIRKYKAEVILSTFPIATSILIGWLLHRVTGKPWVVDLRDSMTEDNYPTDPLTHRVYRWIERRAITHASRIIFTAKSAIDMYRHRYPDLPAEKCLLIPNGYDEEDFRDLTVSSAPNGNGARALRLVHLGLLYPKERDPRPFFRALGKLKQDGKVSATSLRISLRASGSEEVHREAIRQAGIPDIVQLLPPLPYKEALREGAEADAMLVLQGASCNHQIPAKVYEYLRLRKPILALTSQSGDTANLLHEAGGSTVVDIADERAIERELPEFLGRLRQHSHPLPDAARTQRYSREFQARQLAACLNQVAGPAGTAAQ